MIEGLPTPQTPRSRARVDKRSSALACAIVASLAVFAVDRASAANLVVSPVQPRQEDTIAMTAPKPKASRAAESDPALLSRTDSAPVRILVKLDYDPVASYGGDIAGLAATGPAKSGKKLSQNKAAVDAYTAYVAAYETKVLERIRQRVPTAKVGERYRTAYGGVSLTLPANRIRDLLAIDGVVAVQSDSLQHTDSPK